MGKRKLVKTLKILGVKFSKNIPSILSYIGAAGVIGTAVVTAKETPKAIETYKTLHADDPNEKPSLYTISETAKCYIPAAATATATIGCILGGNHLHNKQYGHLFSNYRDLALRHREFKRETSKVLGEAGTAAIAGAAAKNLHPEADTVKEGIADDGLEWFYMPYIDMWFRSDWETVMKAECTIQKEFGAFGYATFANYCGYLGLDIPEVDAACSEDLFWSEYWVGDCCWMHDKGIPIEYDRNYRAGERVGTCIGFVVDPENAELAFPDGWDSIMY